MDGSRFDALTRAVAVSSRRRLLARLAGVTAAGVLGSLGRRVGAEAGVCAEIGQACGGDAGDCCTGRCRSDFTDQIICYALIGQHCESDEQCEDFNPSGPNKFAFCNLPGTNNAACLFCGGAEPCTTDDDCCNRTWTCEPDGNGGSVCTPPCRAENESCNDDADCCPGLGLTCLNTSGSFFCGVACTADGGACADSSECCGEDLVCNGGICGPVVLCANPGEACNADGDCCGDFVCLDNDTCGTLPTCGDEGDDCDTDGDCCAGLTCESGVCTAPSNGAATITIHKATCPRGTGGDIFDACHGNGLGGVGFDVNGVGITTNGDGVAAAVVSAGLVTVTESAGTFGDYLGAYVYCSEQNAGAVLYDGSADGGSVAFAVGSGDDVICDWYNITDAADENDPTTPTSTPTPASGAVTTFPTTGTGMSGSAPTSWMGAAAMGGIAAFLAAKRLRDSAGSDTPAP